MAIILIHSYEGCLSQNSFALSKTVIDHWNIAQNFLKHALYCKGTFYISGDFLYTYLITEISNLIFSLKADQYDNKKNAYTTPYKGRVFIFQEPLKYIHVYLRYMVFTLVVNSLKPDLT